MQEEDVVRLTNERECHVNLARREEVTSKVHDNLGESLTLRHVHGGCKGKVDRKLSVGDLEIGKAELERDAVQYVRGYCVSVSIDLNDVGTVPLMTSDNEYFANITGTLFLSMKS